MTAGRWRRKSVSAVPQNVKPPGTGMPGGHSHNGAARGRQVALILAFRLGELPVTQSGALTRNNVTDQKRERNSLPVVLHGSPRTEGGRRSRFAWLSLVCRRAPIRHRMACYDNTRALAHGSPGRCLPSAGGTGLCRASASGLDSYDSDSRRLAMQNGNAKVPYEKCTHPESVSSPAHGDPMAYIPTPARRHVPRVPEPVWRTVGTSIANTQV
jgi:hypothetical protein